METKGKFYLGRIFDQKAGKTSGEPFLYDFNDLTTHALVVGMTGSGKTGLCIDLLEEAALNNIPALLIDPKGDMTNVLLHFPELLPQDFQPWVNPDQARRAGKPIEQAAAETAETWKKGLADWGIDSQRIQALKDAAHFSIYTPGSDAGMPLSILASLKAPELPWESHREALREKIGSTVTALLGLVGMEDIDPVRSREHILLSNIFEHAWSQAQDLDLSELIMQTQNPPFQKLGVFDVNTFFPEKDRFALAMLLNNILAAPAFQTWIEGAPLDVPALLFGPDGKPRHSVFYIAHLNDAERMFFVTLLFSAVEAWMRAQTGTSTLRALLYFDEIFGYLPPIKNPPSKPPLLRMLKQARAFGLGLMLVTQNPVDVDYKALSNAGTWIIGKLQADQDKQRLLDGLEGATGGAMDRAAYDRILSGLGKRVFLVHNVHASGAVLMQTRWAMNYLAGPLTRTQIPPLNLLAGALQPPPAPEAPPAAVVETEGATGETVKQAPSAAPAAAPAAAAAAAASAAKPPANSTSSRPAVPAGIRESFLPSNLSFAEALKAAGQTGQTQAAFQSLLYRPTLLAQARVRFLNRKYNLDYDLIRTVLIERPDPRGLLRWDEAPYPAVDARSLPAQPSASQARYAHLEAPLSDARTLANLQKDFLDWAYRTSQVTVRANETLKIYAGPQDTQASFRQSCSEAAREKRDAEIQKINLAYERKLAPLQTRLKRESAELRNAQEALSSKQTAEILQHAQTAFSLLGKNRDRRINQSLRKREQKERAEDAMEKQRLDVEALEQQIKAVDVERKQTIDEINSRWGDAAAEMTEIPLTPLKKDVLVELFCVAWFPFYIAQVGDQTLELAAYRAS
jgi:hypothetical protein